MKAAILTDTHVGIRNNSDIFIDYQRRFYEEVFFPYCVENDINEIIHLGDYYDNRKSVNLKALNANRLCFLEKLREYGMHMTIIPGNHDVYWRNTNELCSLNELMGHYLSEVTIVDTAQDYQLGDMTIGLIPWITESNWEHTKHYIEKTSCTIVGAHLELAGFEMQRGVECHGGMEADLFSKFDLVLTGHFHTCSHKANIRYLGSSMEFFWSDAHDDKFFHVLDTTTQQIEAIRNPLTLFARIGYDDTKYDYDKADLTGFDDIFVKITVRRKTDMEMFNRLIDRLQQRNLHDLKIIEDQTAIAANSIDQQIDVKDTDEIIQMYINSMDTDLDRNRLTRMLYDLKQEAYQLQVV